MTKLQDYNKFLGNLIAEVNSDENAEETLKEGYQRSVNDLIDAIYAFVIRKYEIKEGDYETLEQKANEMTLEELFELL